MAAGGKKVELGEGGKARAHVVISGIVQGVFFRSTLRSQAKLLGVGGWTRNTMEGSVEAVFEGDKDQVEKMVTFCWKGPPGAFVRDVSVEWQKPKYDSGSFEIRH
jgi:acylphosphatase